MNFYKTVGNVYGSPEARALYAEISDVEEEHVTQYESLMDPTETWLERWVLHEFTECANYYTCMATEVDPRIKQIWETFLAYELEHLRIAGDTLRRLSGKEPQELCGTELPTPATFEHLGLAELERLGAAMQERKEALKRAADSRRSRVA